MTKRKRRTHSAEFKARIALEALKGIRTIQEIARDEGIHPVQASNWKKDSKARLPELFERKNARNEELEEMKRIQSRLERKVGQLVIEKEFLEKKCVELGVDLNEKP